MNAYAWLAIHDVAAIAAAVVMVITGHPVWAAVFVFMAATATVKAVRKD